MRKIYRKLTNDQISRGVVFSSTLSKYTHETAYDLRHEVFKGDPDGARIIKNLKDDWFFDDSPWKYNIIRK